MLPLPATAAAFTQTTQEKPLLKLKIIVKVICYAVRSWVGCILNVIVNRDLIPICKCTTMELCHAI